MVPQCPYNCSNCRELEVEYAQDQVRAEQIEKMNREKENLDSKE